MPGRIPPSAETPVNGRDLLRTCINNEARALTLTFSQRGGLLQLTSLQLPWRACEVVMAQRRCRGCNFGCRRRGMDGDVSDEGRTGCGDGVGLDVVVSGGQREGTWNGKLPSGQLRRKSLGDWRLRRKRGLLVKHDPCEVFALTDIIAKRKSKPLGGLLAGRAASKTAKGRMLDLIAGLGRKSRFGGRKRQSGAGRGQVRRRAQPRHFASHFFFFFFFFFLGMAQTMPGRPTSLPASAGGPPGRSGPSRRPRGSR